MTSFQQQVGSSEGLIGRRYAYEDGTVLVLDLGVTDGSVDVVDGTVIVVTDDGHREFELPDDTTGRARMNNGIVTVELQEA